VTAKNSLPRYTTAPGQSQLNALPLTLNAFDGPEQCLYGGWLYISGQHGNLRLAPGPGSQSLV
jgi:hypothetical protein